MDANTPAQPPSSSPDQNNRGRRGRRGRRGGKRGGGRRPNVPGNNPNAPQQNGGVPVVTANGTAITAAEGAVLAADGQPQAQTQPSHAGASTLEHRCHRHFPRRARALGHDYFRSGRVSPPTKVDSTLTLQVLGSGPSYNVVFDFTKTAETKSVDVKCDCPYYDGGGLCKHLWASILQIDKAGMGGEIPEKGQLRVVHQKPRPRGEKGEPQQRQAREHTPRPSLPGGFPAVSSWRARLDKIQSVSGGRPANTFAGTWLAYFVINAAETANTGKLVMDLWIRDRLSNGALGPLKPSRLQGHELHRFTDVRDQEVLGVLTKTSDLQTFAPFGRGHAGTGVCSRYTVDPILESHLIPSLISANKLFLSRSPNGSPDDADRPIRMDRGKPWDLELEIETGTGETYRLGGVLKREGETKTVTDPICVFRSSFLLFADRMARLSDPRQVPWVNALRSPEEFLVPKDQGDALVARVLVDPAISNISWPEEIGWSRETINPTPKGVFRPLGNTSITGRMMLILNFAYGDHQVGLDDTSTSFVDVEGKKVYMRNQAFEENTLTEAMRIIKDDTGTFPTADMHRVASELTAAGWQVFIENQRLHIATDYSMNVSSNTDWFDLTMDAQFAGAKVTKPALLAALERNDGMVTLADGSMGMLPKEWLQRYASISEFAEKTDDGGLRFSKTQGLMLHSAIGDDTHVKGDRAYTSFAEKIKKFEGVVEAKAPKGFKGKLRNYQKEGLSWLQFTEEFEMGGILADDMGLGKTIQVLAFLKARKRANKNPCIVIAPKSLVFNWMDEAAKFTPDLKVVSYAGGGRGKLLKEMKEADLVVTTYGTIRTDVEKLKEITFDVAIVDEAQAIKNPEAQSSVAVKELNACYRLALTGTPIENSLQDLFSILEFTSPGMLDIPKGRDLSPETRKTLARMLKPFVLRRTKEKVLTELPEKSEQVLYAEMDPEERENYNQLRDHYRATLTGQIDKGGLGKAKIHVLEALLRLRQASCHPGLVNPEKKGEPSAKLKLLLNQIQEVIQEGHKALVFSQFTSLLALVKDSFDQNKICYEYLDGQTVDRKTPVERFQTDPKCPAFLISLKAGGTGLNLTAADYVFILDPWWNPAVEAQAIGRAHRMGQSNKVFAYRMIARGTVEEKILELQKTKKELAESIFSDEDTSFMKKLTREDLEMLLT